MPNCFQLTPIGQAEPQALQKVDEAICAHMGQPVHPEKWFEDWYNSIGFLYALGKSMDEVIEWCLQGETEATEFKAHYNHLWQVAVFLKANYTVDAWHEPKVRA